MEANRWQDLSTYCCATCRFYVPGKWRETSLKNLPEIGVRHGLHSSSFFLNSMTVGIVEEEGRCRRHAPVVEKGYPVVYPNDFCGDHKLGSNPAKEERESKMREGEMDG